MWSYPLYLVANAKIPFDRCFLETILMAIEGGVSIVQLRAKNISSKDFYQLALEVKKITVKKAVPLIINDKLDIALVVDADGLHIGQEDIPYNKARELLGKNKIIGLSVSNIQQAKQANDFDIDYIGLSPVFFTKTKTNIELPLGLEGIRSIATISKHPMIAIGGINASNVKKVKEAGVQGVAVVSAIMEAENPQNASRLILESFNN